MEKADQDRHPFVSVIIPVYNDPVRLRDAVERLCVQDYPRDSYEIIIVDNGSTSQLRPRIEDLPATVLEEDSIRSSYAARNRGIGAARGRILAFTDADCRPDAGWLKAGVAALFAADAALAGGRIRYRVSKKGTGAEYLDALANSEVERNIVERGVAATANLFVRRDVFNKIGVFPAKVPSGGDIYFTAKATAAGCRLVYANDAVVEHAARRFVSLMRRFFRIGQGKASLMHGLPPNALGARITGKPGRRNRLAQTYPLNLHARLTALHFHVSFFRLLAILFILYVSLTVTALGAAYWFLRHPGYCSKLSPAHPSRETGMDAPEQARPNRGAAL